MFGAWTEACTAKTPRQGSQVVLQIHRGKSNPSVLTTNAREQQIFLSVTGKCHWLNGFP